MCGFMGVFVNGDVDNKYSFDQSTILSHRGPDSNHYMELPCETGSIRIKFFRLAIQELSDIGRQPMLSSNGRYIILFNGEIYNHFKLRERHSLDLDCKSDTKTLVQLIEKLGVKRAIGLLDGMFAICVLDLQEQSLWLTRDRFGIKPLYYTRNSQNTFAFASEIKCFQDLIGTRPSIDFPQLHSFLSHRFVSGKNTVFNEIKRVEANQLLKFNMRSHTVELCCTSVPESSFVNYKNDTLNKYEELLLKAVDAQYLSDVPVGLFLSGGIDSALIAKASSLLGKAPRCFSVGFVDDSSHCELKDAERSAELLGLDFFPVTIEADESWEVLKKAIVTVEEPLVTTSSIALWNLSEAASRSHKVVLTGQGADELLGGYSRYRFEKLRNMLNRFGCIDFGSALLSRLPAAKESKIIAALNNDNFIKRSFSYHRIFTDKMIFELNKEIVKIPQEYSSHWTKSKDPVASLMLHDQVNNLSNDLLIYGDKITMAHSLEARVPFLGSDLSQFLNGIPSKEHVGFMKNKKLQKKLALKWLPDEIHRRPKKGFGVPVASWIKNEWLGNIKKLFQSDLARIYFDQNVLLQILNDHVSGRMDRTKEIFALINVLILLQHWNTDVTEVSTL